MGAEGTGPGTPARALDSFPDLLPAFRGFPASLGASSRVIISSLSLESWTVQPRVLLAAAPGAPRPHHPGAGMCALRAPAPPPSHVCAAGARGPRGARHRAAPPGVGDLRLWAGPGRAP